jgi:hypothetical protein
MQGTDSLPTHTIDQPTSLARQAWKFGGADTMHGQKADYNRGPQRSADNWHRLNFEGQHMLGAGETLLVVNPSPSGRSATLVYKRPVPPALGGKPGTLLLRVQHRAGVPLNDPNARILLKRAFPVDLQRAEAAISDELELQALAADGHRKLYATAQRGAFASSETPALGAGAPAELIIALTPAAQAELRALADAPPGGDATGTKPEDDAMRWNVLFQWLAGAFGLAFVGALIASLRWPRDKQLDRLATLPASRAEVLKTLSNLEADYRAGRIPAGAYVEQRQRLLNRLIEFDSRGPSEGEDAS